MAKTLKNEVITFKVDEALSDAIKHIRNRSEFIRSAIMAALDCTCPICRGTGILTAHQMEDMKLFLDKHNLKECSTCHGIHISEK